MWLEITTLLIPGHNDSDSEVQRLSAWVARQLGADVPLHFTAFHPDWQMRHVPPTPRATLRRARELAMREGLRHVYTGNALDRQGETTYCAACGKELIARQGYEVLSWRLDDTGTCRGCGSPCAGVFAAAPGRWGARRRPLRLAP